MAGMRKIPKWTKAMRQRAAEAGRRGDREAKRRGGQAGGLLSWHTKSPEEQAAALARLRAYGGHQANKSPKAKAAQRARGKAGMERLSARKAGFLADIGVLGRAEVPACPSVAPTQPQVQGAPERAAYPDSDTWLAAMKVWVKRYRESLVKV